MPLFKIITPKMIISNSQQTKIGFKKLLQQKSQKILIVVYHHICAKISIIYFFLLKLTVLVIYNVGVQLIIFNKNKMSKIDEKRLVLIKFQPEQILFMHRDSRVIYRYFNLNQDMASYPNIDNNMLQTGILFNKGVLYQKEHSNLMLEVNQRKRSFNKNHFHQEEIVNTFLPLLQAVQQLHQQGIVHGSIRLQNIVIIDSELKLRDWLAETGPSNKTENDDWAALGQCILSCTFLIIGNNIRSEGQKIIGTLVQRMSKNFIITLLIFLRQLKPYYKYTSSIISGQSNHIDAKLNGLYQELKTLEKKKKNAQENQNKQVLAFSPAKKLGLTHKRVAHHENIENKMEGESKKLQKSSKINEKSSSSIHQLMNKKLNEQQKKIKEQNNAKKGKDKTPIINLSNFGMQNNSKKFQLKQLRWSPKRLRTFSKKK